MAAETVPTGYYAFMCLLMAAPALPIVFRVAGDILKSCAESRALKEQDENSPSRTTKLGTKAAFPSPQR